MGLNDKLAMNTAIPAAVVTTTTTPAATSTTSSGASQAAPAASQVEKSNIQVFGQTTKPATLQPAGHLPLVPTKPAQPAPTPKPATPKPQVGNHAGNAAQKHSGNPFANAAQQPKNEVDHSIIGYLNRTYPGFNGFSKDKQIELIKRQFAKFKDNAGLQLDKVSMYIRNARNTAESSLFGAAVPAVQAANQCKAVHIGLTSGSAQQKHAFGLGVAANIHDFAASQVSCVGKELVKTNDHKIIVTAAAQASQVHESKQAEFVGVLQQTANKKTLSDVNISLVNQYGKFAKSAELPIHAIITDSSVKKGLQNIVQYSATKLYKFDKTHQAAAVGITLSAAHKTKDIQTVRLIAREYDAFDASARGQIKEKITRMVSTESFIKNDSVTQQLLHQAEYRITTGQKPLTDLNEKYFSNPNKTIETRIIESQTPNYSGVVEENNTNSQAETKESAQAENTSSAKETAISQNLSQDEQTAVKKITEGKNTPTAKDFNTILDILGSNKLGQYEKQTIANMIMNSSYMKSQLSQIPTLDPALQMLLVETYISSGNVMDLKDKVDMFTNKSAQEKLQNKINEEKHKNFSWLMKKVF